MNLYHFCEDFMNPTKTLIQSYYQAFNEKRFEDMLTYLSEDVLHDTNQGGRTKGKAAFREFMKEMDTFYDEHLTEITIMTNEDGTRASAEFVCNGTYNVTCEGLPPASGQKYNLPVGCFFEIAEGKILRVTNYYNMQDWINQIRA